MKGKLARRTTRVSRAKQMRREQRAELARRVRRLRRSLKAIRRGIRRRDFLVGAASAGAFLSAPALMSGCSHDEDVAPGTIFFNLAHEDFHAKTYFLTGGGKTYRLTKVTDKPEVLERARRKNGFLRAVPDSQITHHIEGTAYATNGVSLVYLSSDYDTTEGTWTMSAVYLQLPAPSLTHAYSQARMRTPTGPLPLSPKRQMYGVAAANSEQDLREEQALFDTNDQAAAIVGSAPDLFSLEPNSAAHIQTNHVNTNGDVATLGRDLQRAYGPAVPPGVPATKTPWASLVPVVNDDTGQPFKNTQGTHAGRVQYMPALDPTIASFVGQAATTLSGAVKDDPSLGADVTSQIPQPGAQPNLALTGAMWVRRDGVSSVNQSPGAGLQSGSAPSMALKQTGPQNGIEFSASTTQSGNTQQVSLTLDNFYVRFLGVYLQFYAPGNTTTPLNLADIPEYAAGTISSGHDPSNDTATEFFVGVLGPEFTILAIPTWAGTLAANFNVPASASTVRILASGIGAGSNNYPDTVLMGEVMTGIISYGVTSALCAAGAAAALSGVMAVANPILNALAQELVAAISAAINGHGIYTTGFWQETGLALAKFICWFVSGRALSIAIGKLVGAVVGATTEGAAEDAIPIVGWIMFGISIAVGVANLIETSVEVALSPFTYVNDLVFTHDLSVSIAHDINDGTFPQDANQYVVTALFDDGTPYTQTLALPSPAPATIAPVVFTGLPLGGNVNVSVAFNQNPTTANGPLVLLGKGSTGLIANNASASPAITIQEVTYPINASTVYQHKQKTTLDSGGNHVWTPTDQPPTVNSADCGTAGTLCGFNGITVRQGTGAAPGFVGYSWRGQSTSGSEGAECGGGGLSQLDQMANLNTGPDAQDEYLAGPCGQNVSGVKLSYSLLTHGTNNFYLDTSNPDALHLRQIALDPPSFEPPSASNPMPASQSWGVLNFMPDVLLLHPAGHVVSISNAHNKMETLKIPPGPLPDAQAAMQLLAQPKCGSGSRPGLMTNPVAATVAADGTILVIEAGAPTATTPLPARIQAFDIGGNPKPFFPQQPVPYVLELTATPNTAGWQYLDLAIEYGGFIYVLSQLQGTNRLDIYSPGQTGTAPISTTTGFNAAKIAVDFWRNVYTLNYEVIPTTGSPPAFTEPSISLWVPSDSCVGANCTP